MSYIRYDLTSHLIPVKYENVPNNAINEITK